jgi:hypothetical protein
VRCRSRATPLIDRTDDEQAACDHCHRLLQQRSLGALV